jgi:F-type H+-transporting ATPase subunit b
VRPFLALAYLASAAVAAASEGAAGHGEGIPWADILKQAVNFAILAGALVYFLKKPISSFLKERSEQLRKSIEDAARAREEAAARLSAIEARTSRLQDEIAGMNRKMEVEAEEEARRIRETAQAEIERVRIQAQFAADQEVKKAREELRKEAADLATATAEEMVKKAMTPEDQERLVRENVEKIREIVQ